MRQYCDLTAVMVLDICHGKHNKHEIFWKEKFGKKNSDEFSEVQQLIHYDQQLKESNILQVSLCHIHEEIAHCFAMLCLPSIWLNENLH